MGRYETEIEFLTRAAEELDHSPCIAFDDRGLGGQVHANWMCNRPASIHACRGMITCRLCWLRCEMMKRVETLTRRAA